MSQSLILIDALSSACWENKEKGKKIMREKKREVAWSIFPRVSRNFLLAVQGRILTTVRLKADLRVSL
jgi:hypothetical protein